MNNKGDVSMSEIAYAVFTVAPNGHKAYLEGPFKTEDEAYDYAKSLGGEFIDENGYRLSLVVDEELLEN